MHPIVIVGSGLAGYTLLKEFRKRDTRTPVTLVTADGGAFYSKPNLSNALAAGRTAAALAGASAEKLAADLECGGAGAHPGHCDRHGGEAHPYR